MEQDIIEELGERGLTDKARGANEKEMRSKGKE